MLGGADTTVLTKLPAWLQLLFLLAGCSICWREHKNMIMLAEQYEKMLRGADKAFEH